MDGCGLGLRGHLPMLGQHFLAADAEEVLKNTPENNKEADAAPGEVVGFRDDDKDVVNKFTSDFAGDSVAADNNNANEYEEEGNSKLATRLWRQSQRSSGGRGGSGDRSGDREGGGGGAGGRDGRLTAFRLARARSRGVQQAAFDGRCGDGGGGGGGGGEGEGQQIRICGNGDDDDDYDYTEACSDDEEEIEADDNVNRDLNQQVLSRFVFFFCLLHHDCNTHHVRTRIYH